MEKETNETEKPSEAEKVFELICEDYEKAMVHILILLTQDDEKHLLFAQVECLPEEFRDVPEISYDYSDKKYKRDKTCIYKNIKRDKTYKRLDCYRILMKTKEALDWYRQCIINKIAAIPQENNLPKDFEVKCCGPFVEPALCPNL